MNGLIAGFPYGGMVTVNRVILNPGYTVDERQEHVALLCDNVKTYHSDSGFVGGFVILDSGQISNEGSTIPTRPGTVRKRRRSDCLRHALVGARR